MRHLQTKVPSFNLGTLTSFVLRHQISIAVTILVKPLTNGQVHCAPDCPRGRLITGRRAVTPHPRREPWQYT